MDLTNRKYDLKPFMMACLAFILIIFGIIMSHDYILPENLSINQDIDLSFPNLWEVDSTWNGGWK